MAAATARCTLCVASALLPRRGEAGNLVVPVALAASAVAFSSARIESMLMGTGAAAGVVARLAAGGGALAVQDVPVAAVQAALVGQVGAVIHGPPTLGGALHAGAAQ
jgi:hypothetical protein